MNLNVELVDLGPCKKQLRFELPVEDVDVAFGEVTKQFQKQANLAGFRKGKAPLDKVLARFSQQIEDEVQKKLLNDSYRKGVEDNSLKPVLDPEVDEVNFKKVRHFLFSPISRPRRSLSCPNIRASPPSAPRWR